MIAAAATALSGLLAQSARVAGSAANLANQRTTGALSGGGAQGSAAAYQPVAVGTVSQPGGGVSASVRPLVPATVPEYDPSSADADASGMVAAPNVDQGAEATTLISAGLAYKTGLKVLKVADEMTRSALDLKA